MKRIFSIALTLILVFSLSACKKTGNLSSDIESDLSLPTNHSMTESVNTESESTSSEEETPKDDEENESSQTDTVINSSSESSSSQSSVSSSASKKPVASENTPSKEEPKKETLSPRQKMVGTWRLMIPENTITPHRWHDSAFFFVYDIVIREDEYIYVIEKEYIRSDTMTVGAVEYFDGKRYTLANNSMDLWGAYKGTLSTEGEKVAVLNIKGEDMKTGRFLIEETHHLTLVDDTHLQWNACYVHTEWFSDQYFPWDASTVFTKQ